MNTLNKGLVLCILLLFSASAGAAERINTLESSLFGFKPSGVAIRGYDTVAYHTQGVAIPGSDSFTASWRGANWKFGSAEHRDLFVADPEKYAPRFGGYCAYGVAFGSLLKIEGDQWVIVDGRLYLNFDEEWLQKWKQNAQELIALAEIQYPQLVER